MSNQLSLNGSPIHSQPVDADNGLSEDLAISTNVDTRRVKIGSDLKRFGAVESAKMSGNPIGLEFWAQKIYYQFLAEVGEVDENQQRLIGIEQQKVAKLFGEIDELKAKNIHIEEVQIPEQKVILAQKNEQLTKEISAFQDEIDKIEQEIQRIKGGDEALVPERLHMGERIGYYVGWVLLTLVSGYLFLFYTSAIYNAFLLKPESTLQSDLLSSTIINPRAIPDAWNAYGPWAIILILAPFVFFGLGFLLYRFPIKDKKNWLTVGFIYLFTFAFDCLLAYEIVRKMYKIAQKTDPDLISWNNWDAFSRMEFYIIISAGFVVYILWGIIFNFLLQESAKLQPVLAAINLRKKIIQQIKVKMTATRDAANTRLQELQNAIAELLNQKNKQHSIILEKETEIKTITENIQVLSRTVKVPTALIIERIKTFAVGWISYIDLAFHGEYNFFLTKECDTKLTNFIQFILNEKAV